MNYSSLCVYVAVESEVWREVVLSRLLTVVELPILDSILSEETSHTDKSRKSDMAFSNMAFKRQESSFSSLISNK